MIQFRAYPIYILYSRHTQDGADQTAFDFSLQGDKKMYWWMKTTGRSKMELVEDSAPAYRAEAAEYEKTIKDEMDTIVTTDVGRCLLNSMNSGAKIYIIPDPELTYKAITVQGEAIAGGGIRIHINPSDWVGTLDDTLVHELTHALRFSYSRMLHKPIGHEDFGDAEEFMATQVANVYRSSLGKTQLYGTYNRLQDGVWSSKGTIYSMLVETPLLIMALKYCLDQEGFIAQIARSALKQPDFNPFRDYPILERMALGKTQIQGMPAGKFMPL